MHMKDKNTLEACLKKLIDSVDCTNCIGSCCMLVQFLSVAMSINISIRVIRTCCGPVRVV